MKKQLDSTANLGRHFSAVITAFMVPVTTSGTAIALSFLIIFTLLSTPQANWRTLQCPAAILPATLFGVVAVSMLWSPTPFGPGGASHYAKLLLIPLLMAGTFNSRQAMHIACGFAAACTLLLVLSLASLLWPPGPWGWFKGPGIPVKDNAVQSTCFSLCAFGLAVCSIRFFQANKKLEGSCTSLLAIMLFADVFLITLSKTGMLIACALSVRLLAFVDGWRLRFAIAISLCLIASLAVTFSSLAQRRVVEIETDIHAMNVGHGNTQVPSTTPETKQATPGQARQPTMSTASRIDFWLKAIEFVKQAPLIGHGAGSTKSLYASLETDRPSPYGEAVPDPHNQFLAIAIQAGLLGGAALIVMWAVHINLFMGRTLPHLFGQAVVLQNVLGSLFNSQLSQVTQGVLYCLAIGLVGSLLRREPLARQEPDRGIPAADSRVFGK